MTGEDEPEAGAGYSASRSHPGSGKPSSGSGRTARRGRHALPASGRVPAGGGRTAVEARPADDAYPTPADGSIGQAPAGRIGQIRSGLARIGQIRAPKHARATAARRRPLWKELPILVAAALAIALLIKTFLVQAFYIPSGSMQNTLEIGNKVLVNKLVYHIRPIRAGDIIVFDGAGSWDAAPAASPSRDPLVRAYDATLRPLLHAIAGLFGTAPGQTDYIKRVIGVPGDRVACCNSQGLITVNGVALHETSYLFPGNKSADAPEGEPAHFRLTVPPGRLWVLGDHRDISDDSRGHEADPGNGTIPENKVIGRAFMIVWPPSRWRVLRIPQTFSQRGITPAAAADPGSGAGRRVVEADLAAGGRLAPARPYLPLGAGLAGALPLTYLRRRYLLAGRRLNPVPARRQAAGHRRRLRRRGGPCRVDRIPANGRVAARWRHWRPDPALGSIPT